MGYLGTAGGILKAFGKTLTRFYGASLAGNVNPIARAIQWLEGGTDDGLNLLDKVGTLTQPQVTNRKVLTFDGVGDYITFPVNMDATASSTNLKIVNIQFLLITPSVSATTYKTLYSAGDVIIYHNNGLLVAGVRDTIGAGSAYAKVVPFTDTSSFHRITLQYTTHNTGVDLWLDGSLIENIGSSVYPHSTSGTLIGGRTNHNLYGNYKVGKIELSNGVTQARCTTEEGAGSTAYDTSGNGNHGTITTTSGLSTMWAGTASGIPSYQALDGFDLYTHATSDPIYVPHKTDGTSLTITPPTGYSLDSVHPGGFVLNGGSYTETQLDAYFTGGTVNFYSADGINADDKTFAQFLDHYNSRNGAYNLWIKLSAEGFIEWAVQLPLDFEWTPSQYIKMAAIFGGTPVIPLQAVVGGIGPNGDWFTYDGTHIILVENI